MKDEARLRWAKARQFLAEADNADPKQSPLSIVHNAYYAMFHSAMAVLATRMAQPPTRHGMVIGAFGRLVKDMGDEGKRYGRAFNDAQELRLACDYAPQSVPTFEDAASVRENAKGFLEFCEKRFLL
jgi:uncharacterized protein (UPF0332 family)